MKRIYFYIFLLSLLVFSCYQRKDSLKNEINIEVAKRGAIIPTSMYGVFFEEINHAGDGGIYAELIQNRSFEEKEMPSGYYVENGNLHSAKGLVNHITGESGNRTFRWSKEEFPGWTLKKEDDVKADMRLTKLKPLHPETPNSMQITISSAKRIVALVNSGYWGIACREGQNYHLRFFLRTGSDYKGSVTAKLVSSSNKVLAEQKFKVTNNGIWIEYKSTLKVSETDTKATFALEFDAGGTVFVDYVSLFPEKTFKNRPNGLRADVAQYLAYLRPAFIRWPGGCIVEGISLNNRVEWKKTLGDPMSRPGQYSTWGYRNSYGFGYHEFLQYCEDVGAKGMYVCNIGLGCQARVGDACNEDELSLYLKDALDAIEYAIGAPSTTWGAKRAREGHPEPFPLQYVEIGNENSGKVYDNRFDLFYKTIKEKYPQLTLISNHGLSDNVRNIQKTDMIDPHWYVEPDYFFRNATVFDSIKREKYKIYVGEYACNKKVDGGNMLAALSEAAFLTGMERNSDLVTMASYAPLFENRNDRTWPVNLIWIDNDKVVGRSSYYVQKMFAENRSAVNLPTEVILPELPDKIPLQAGGSVGFGSQVATVEYKELKVYSEDHIILLANSTASDYNFNKGEWKELSSSTIAQNGLEMRTIAVLKEKPFENCTIEFEVCKKGGAGSLLFYFGLSDDNKTGYAFRVGAGANHTVTFLQKIENGELGGRLCESINPPIENNNWVHVKIVVGTYDVALLINNVSVLKYTAKPVRKQFVVSGYNDTTREIVVKVVNAESKPFRTTIKLIKSGNVSANGNVTTFSAVRMEDENSFEEPTKIVPVESVFKHFSSNFDYQFEPNSLTILRIKEQK